MEVGAGPQRAMCKDKGSGFYPENNRTFKQGCLEHKHVILSNVLIYSTNIYQAPCMYITLFQAP